MAVVAVVLAVVPAWPAQAQTNPLGRSDGHMAARGCYMAYRLSPGVGGISVEGALDCNDPWYWLQLSVTVLDNGVAIDDERLAGDPGCGFELGATRVGCLIPTERGHVYTVVFDFYMEGAGSQLLPYPNDPFNAGTCSSSPFTRSEFDQLECEAALHFLETR